MRILVINSGSSSIRYQFFLMPEEELIAKGIVEGIGEEGSSIKSHRQGLSIILKDFKDIDAIGHRVVHGGEGFRKPCLINNSVIKRIKDCVKLAPLHNPANLQGILSCRRLLYRVPQVAVFDTSFFQTMPEYVFIYALPYRFYKNYGIRRYGFHGTSHEYIAGEAARIFKKNIKDINLITCHLGNGCSVAAIRGGIAIETSLGFTPLEGLVMGTRCGDIDPAIVTFLQKEKLSINRVEEILNYESGLKGISGLSNDMRILIKSKTKRARLAIEIFIHRIRKYIGAYITILQKIDAVVFTAGIGENQPNVINRISKGLFSNLKYPPRVLVIHTNEELLIARKAYELLKN